MAQKYRHGSEWLILLRVKHVRQDKVRQLVDLTPVNEARNETRIQTRNQASDSGSIGGYSSYLMPVNLGSAETVIENLNMTYINFVYWVLANLTTSKH